MFTEKQKLERELLKELTKIGDLFDSSRIEYFVLGSYTLTARGIITDFNENYIIAKTNNKKRIIEKMLKLGFTLTNTNDHLEFMKDTRAGDIIIKIYPTKDNSINIDGVKLKLLEDSFENERIEVPSLTKGGKAGSGYFKVSKMEELYFLWLGKRPMVLMQMKNSGRIDYVRLMKLLEVNGKL